MKLPILLATAAVIAAPTTSTKTVQDGESLPAPAAAPSPVQAAPRIAPVRLPGFAAALAQEPDVKSPATWVVAPDKTLWRKIATAPRTGLQRARWDYVRSMIGQDRGADAFSVLEVMRQDDPDLLMVNAFRIARGAAQVMVGRADDAFASLSEPGLLANAEACAWRLRALSALGKSREAYQQVDCARPAMDARKGHDRRSFLIAAARVAVESGHPDYTLRVLADVPDRDPAANLYRGRANLGLGRREEARLRFARVEQSGTMEQRMDARLSQIEAEVATRSIARSAALKQINDLRFKWRGDRVEERALALGYRLSGEAGDLRGAISTGAALFRFYDPVNMGPNFVTGLQSQLARALDPASGLKVDQAAGLYWDYRDIAPAGAEGDQLVSRLADRLQGAGLYKRAGDLLEHQLYVRAKDVAQGPLSIRVATLHILAGRPDRAVKVMRDTANNPYPAEMLQDRQRVEAVALGQLGRSKEAMALLQEVPDAGPLRVEILWRNRDWSALVREASGDLPPPSAQRLSEVGQASVLRFAIALAMIGREEDLATLRARYAAQFTGLASAPVFELLTGRVGAADPESLARAMAAIPTASGAGRMAQLLDAAPAPGSGRGT